MNAYSLIVTDLVYHPYQWRYPSRQLGIGDPTFVYEQVQKARRLGLVIESRHCKGKPGYMFCYVDRPERCLRLGRLFDEGS